MLAPEVISNLELHIACIKAQHTPECNRDCVHCDKALSKTPTLETLDTALKVIKFVEQKRREHESNS